MAKTAFKSSLAIGRSLDVYYRDGARRARMDALNAVFVTPGALVFDIGAHVGDRSDSFARLGARVIALEPQPQVFRALRLILGRRPHITLRNEAVGATSGHLKLYINSANPTVSTASQDLIAAAHDFRGWQGQDWDTATDVPVTTLDMLIAEFGVPDFVKIDVEGYEREVLKGLGRPLPLLSFEFTTVQRDVGLACIDEITKHGRYAFNYSLGEDHKLRWDGWRGADDMRTALGALPDAANSGDIFARRLN